MIEHNMLGMNDDARMQHLHFDSHQNGSNAPHDRMPILGPGNINTTFNHGGHPPTHLTHSNGAPSPGLGGCPPGMLPPVAHCNGDGIPSGERSPSRGGTASLIDSNGNIEPTEAVSEPGLCAGCGGKIVDRYFLMAVEKQWHLTCLTCTDCNLQLDSELTCFAKDGQIYCKEDYYRRFAVKKCARCDCSISASELVMKARQNVYHINCFTCVSCHNRLSTGEHFGMQGANIYCKTHYEMALHHEEALLNNSTSGPQQGLHPHHPHHPGLPFLSGTGTIQKGRPRKRKSPLPDGDLCMPMGMCNENDIGLVSELYSGGHNIPRQKRVRTSFKHHQLRTMKSYFNLNHNPDAKDLKQLAQKTGLSKRVLQVWFQNARAKYRRGVLKDPQGRDIPPENCEEGSIDMTGLPDMSQTGSPAMSDISCSDNSMSDHIHSTNNNHQTSLSDNSDHSQSTGSTLTELFTNSINTIN